MQKIKQHPFIAAGILILIAIVATIAFTVAIFKLGWDWTGFNGGHSTLTITTETPLPQGGKITRTDVYQLPKTLWDWMNYITAGFVTVMVTLLATQVSAQQKRTELEIALSQQQEGALQAYIDKMSELLLKEGLRESKPEDEVQKIARVRTLTVLPQLDGKRKGSVLKFLFESGLIDKNRPIIDLSGADLRDAKLFETNLVGADLHRADLRGAELFGTMLIEADLHRANLNGADLNRARLNRTNLEGAQLANAHLNEAELTEANLQHINMERAALVRTILHNANMQYAGLGEADLRSANLRGADLSLTYLIGANLCYADLSGAILLDAKLEGADLSGAILLDANLEGARLNKANVKIDQLNKARSLLGATMPDGSIHP